ncbi:MAG: hypothetical protein KJ023_20310, partial [Burkholderiaceae bacterium]|nr:hypothetical protein [Burkholderiaceae bacterium]
HKVLTLADGSEWVDPAPFHRHSGVLELEGRQTSGGPKFWRLASWVEPGSGQALWERDKFVLNTSGGNNLTGNVGHAVLREAIDVSVNLAALAEGERALIVVGSRVRTLNRFNGESLVVAYLRDPVTLPAAQPSQPGQPRQAVTVTEISGLTLSAPPALPEGFTPQPGAAAPACASAALPRAVLQFGAAAYSVFEDDAGMRVVTVTRGGSTQGEVTARVRATAGTATAGVDFAPLDVLVRFGDGDATPRSIVVPVQDDTALEGPKTLTLSLSEAAGCADLGVIATATVTIEDDETPASAGFTIGGTVSGLAGSGLVVETLVDTLAIAADGTFQFARTFPTGYLYRVQVTSQPQDPRQACTVANGEGTVGSAAVTNVQITCTTLAEPGSLDPGFGSGGRAWSDGLGPPVPLNTKMARQADGKLLVVGGGSGVLRLLADGTPDAGFGPAGNGVAAVPMAGGDDVNLASVAVQPDGRILVAGAGRVGVSGRFDMLVARLHANGTLDTGFAGGTGIGRFDHAAWNDGATQVLVQADGSILLAGSLADGSGVGTDFAVLRLSAAGLLDTAYGSNGWARVNVGGGYDVPRAAVLAPDGGVVLAGRVGASGGSNGDIGLAKFTAAGLPDAGFGSLGNGTLRLITTAHDEARDIVVLADGRLVVVGERASTNTGGPALLWLARYLANGQPDTTFGSAGVATLATPLAGWAVAVQADGTVWAAGGITSADGSHTDYGLARFTAAGQPDAGFGTGGLLGIDFFGSFDTPATLVVQPDGKVVLAGSARNGSTYGLGVVRVVP